MIHEPSSVWRDRSESMNIYMLDTNVFNHLVEGKISLTPFDKHRLLTIGVQLRNERFSLQSSRRSNPKLYLRRALRSTSRVPVGIKPAGMMAAENSGICSSDFKNLTTASTRRRNLVINCGIS